MKTILSIISGMLMVSAVFLASCDPDGGYEYWVDNQSDSSLYVIFREINNPKINRLRIGPDEKIMFEEYETINGLYDEQDNFLNYWSDSLAIFTDTLLKVEIKKDYLNRNSWSYDPKETGIFGKAGKNVYTLTVLNSDLKK